MRIFTKTFSKNHDFRIIVYVPGDVSIGGDIFDHFYVLAEEREDGFIVSCDFSQEEILERFPECASIVAMNTSDAQGVPTHAKAMGLYYLAGALGGLGERFHGNGSPGCYTHTQCRTELMKKLRLSPVETADLINATREIALKSGNQAAKDNFMTFVEEQHPRWLDEARKVIRRCG